MTTKVTIECYNYPVLIEQLSVQNNNPQGRWEVLKTVQPGEKDDFTLHSSVQFKLTELPQVINNDSSRSL